MYPSHTSYGHYKPLPLGILQAKGKIASHVLTEYKICAKTQEQIDIFIDLMSRRDLKFEDVEVLYYDEEDEYDMTFMSTLSAVDLESIFDEIPNGLSVCETLALASRFDGERTERGCSWLFV